MSDHFHVAVLDHDLKTRRITVRERSAAERERTYERAGDARRAILVEPCGRGCLGPEPQLRQRG